MSTKTEDDRTINATIGAAVRASRVTKGVTQRRMASDIGVTYQQLQNYETGKTRIYADRLHQMAGYLKVPVSAFFQQPVDGDDAYMARRITMELIRNFHACPPHIQKSVADLAKNSADQSKIEK